MAKNTNTPVSTEGVSPPSNKEKILNAAADLIQTEGVAAASLSNIAKAAEVAKGTLHYYYRSKSDLLFDLAERQAVEFSRRFLELADKSKINGGKNEMISQIVADILAHGNNSILIHLMIEGATRNSDLNNRFKKLYQDLSKTIETGFSRLYSSTISSDVADIILSSLIGLLFNTVVRSKGINPDVFIQFINKGIGVTIVK